MSVGLHFNLTEGQPLSEDIQQSSLVENGKFIGKPAFYEIINAPHSFTEYQIAMQLKAQIKKFI